MDVVVSYMRFLNARYPGWERGFFRFVESGNSYGGNGSCVVGGQVELVDVDSDQGEFHRWLSQAGAFLRGVGKERGVILFVVESSGKGGIHFEYRDLRRWEITLLDGGTGIPEGF